MRARAQITGSIPWVLAGIFAGGILHILCIFGMPWLAEQDAWGRLSSQIQPNTLAITETNSAASLPFSSPDVIQAYCPFDLSQRNVVVTSPLPDAPWSLAVSARSGENFYLITGADVKKSEVRVLIIPRDRLPEEASTEQTEEGGEQNIIVSPTTTGIVAIRAPIRGESYRSQTLAQLRQARCETQKPFEPVIASAPEPAAPERAAATPRPRSSRRGHR
jgi:uncharacterized membrane protein